MLDGDRLHLGPLEQLVAQRRRQLAAGRGLRGQRCDLGGSQPLRQPLATEIGDRRHEDEHLGQHDEQDREQQQLGRQSRQITGRPSVLRSYARRFVLHEHHS